MDKTGLQTQMYRQYAHSKRGKRVNIGIRGKRHARIGLVAAQCEGTLLVPHTYSGTMKASVFEVWFEEDLLKKPPKEHVSIMDNASLHKKKSCIKSQKILADLDFFCRRIHLNTILLSTSGARLKRKVTSCVHLYDSVSQALNAILEGNEL